MLDSDVSYLFVFDLSLLIQKTYANSECIVVTNEMNIISKTRLKGNEQSNVAQIFPMLRKGHLEEVFHIFSYLKINHIARVMVDPLYLNINEDFSIGKYWSIYYGNDAEAIPTIETPTHKGRELITRAFVDASSGGCKLTR